MKILKYMAITYITQATCRRLTKDLPVFVNELIKSVREIREIYYRTAESVPANQYVQTNHGPEGKVVNKIGF